MRAKLEGAESIRKKVKALFHEIARKMGVFWYN
jgi:hypothetical protein